MRRILLGGAAAVAVLASLLPHVLPAHQKGVALPRSVILAARNEPVSPLVGKAARRAETGKPRATREILVLGPAVVTAEASRDVAWPGSGAGPADQLTSGAPTVRGLAPTAAVTPASSDGAPASPPSTARSGSRAEGAHSEDVPVVPHTRASEG